METEECVKAREDPGPPGVASPRHQAVHASLNPFAVAGKLPADIQSPRLSVSVCCIRTTAPGNEGAAPVPPGPACSGPTALQWRQNTHKETPLHAVKTT